MTVRPVDRRIELVRLRCPGRHGAYAGERDATRVFLVDISARGALGDRDLDTLAIVTRSAVAGRSRVLLERVAADVADAILAAIDRVSEVRVRVAKPDPPGLDAAAEAVTLTRSRVRSGARAPSARRAPREPRRARG